MNAHKPYNREAGRPLEPASTAGVSGSPAEAPATLPEFTCRNCEGSGQSEYMGLNEDRYHWRTCWDCDGSGEEEPYCGCCGGKLNPALFCHQCDEFESLVYVDRIAPGRIAV